jgi:hypothetical protein
MELGNRVAGSRIVGSVSRWRQTRATARLPGTVSVVVPAGNPRFGDGIKIGRGSTASRRGCPPRSALADRRRLGSGCGRSASRRGSGCGPSRPGTLPGASWWRTRMATCATRVGVRVLERFPPAVDPAGVPMSAQASRSPGGSGAGWGGRSGQTRSLAAHPGAAGPAPATGELSRRRSARAWAIDGVTATMGRPMARRRAWGSGRASRLRSPMTAADPSAALISG